MSDNQTFEKKAGESSSEQYENPNKLSCNEIMNTEIKNVEYKTGNEYARKSSSEQLHKSRKDVIPLNAEDDIRFREDGRKTSGWKTKIRNIRRFFKRPESKKELIAVKSQILKLTTTPQFEEFLKYYKKKHNKQKEKFKYHPKLETIIEKEEENADEADQMLVLTSSTDFEISVVGESSSLPLFGDMTVQLPEDLRKQSNLDELKREDPILYQQNDVDVSVVKSSENSSHLSSARNMEVTIVGEQNLEENAGETVVGESSASCKDDMHMKVEDKTKYKNKRKKQSFLKKLKNLKKFFKKPKSEKLKSRILKETTTPEYEDFLKYCRKKHNMERENFKFQPKLATIMEEEEIDEEAEMTLILTSAPKQEFQKLVIEKTAALRNSDDLAFEKSEYSSQLSSGDENFEITDVPERDSTPELIKKLPPSSEEDFKTSDLEKMAAAQNSLSMSSELSKKPCKQSPKGAMEKEFPTVNNKTILECAVEMPSSHLLSVGIMGEATAADENIPEKCVGDASSKDSENANQLSSAGELELQSEIGVDNDVAGENISKNVSEQSSNSCEGDLHLEGCDEIISTQKTRKSFLSKKFKSIKKIFKKK